MKHKDYLEAKKTILKVFNSNPNSWYSEEEMRLKLYSINVYLSLNEVKKAINALYMEGKLVKYNAGLFVDRPYYRAFD